MVNTKEDELKEITEKITLQKRVLHSSSSSPNEIEIAKSLLPVLEERKQILTKLNN